MWIFSQKSPIFTSFFLSKKKKIGISHDLKIPILFLFCQSYKSAFQQFNAFADSAQAFFLAQNVCQFHSAAGRSRFAGQSGTNGP